MTLWMGVRRRRHAAAVARGRGLAVVDVAAQDDVRPRGPVAAAAASK